MDNDNEISPVSPFAFDVVVMAASLGGIEALTSILSALPAAFPTPILVVQHLSPSYPSELAALLNRRTALTVKWGEHGEHISPGTVYLAPPDHHMLVNSDGILALSRSPHQQFVRPSANPLFESAASSFGKRALAVVLTGLGSDGARGVRAIKEQGGTVLVQNCATSRAFNMPQAALRTGCVDFALSLHTLARALIALVMVKGAASLFRVQKVLPGSHARANAPHWGAVNRTLLQEGA
jgi:two-component system, chemotaxis family, protein-glutamate methylesterase/glutaminase